MNQDPQNSSLPASVTGDPSGVPCYSSVWVGLDGTSGPKGDLVQAGTEQDAVYIYPFGTSHNYFA